MSSRGGLGRVRHTWLQIGRAGGSGMERVAAYLFYVSVCSVRKTLAVHMRRWLPECDVDEKGWTTLKARTVAVYV